MSQARALSSEDISGLREELAAGTTPTVWFTASAVGVQQGRSGKVTALGEPAEGDFIQVRPAGSKDVLSFSAGEVTVVKPARKGKESGERSAGAAKSTTAKSAATPAKSTTKTSEKPATSSQKSREKSSEKQAAKTTGNAADTSSATSGDSGTKAASGGTTKRKPVHPAGATVTLTADAEGHWSVEVSNGKKRVLRPTSVTASAVGQAAKALHSDVVDAVEPLLEAAREQQRSRIEQLQRELSEAQQKLDELDH